MSSRLRVFVVQVPPGSAIPLLSAGAEAFLGLFAVVVVNTVECPLTGKSVGSHPSFLALPIRICMVYGLWPSWEWF